MTTPEIIRTARDHIANVGWHKGSARGFSRNDVCAVTAMRLWLSWRVWRRSILEPTCADWRHSTTIRPPAVRMLWIFSTRRSPN